MEVNRLFDALENETNVSIMDQTSRKIKAQKNNIRGCYSSSIQTVDVCSKRWKKFTPSILRIWKLKKEFNKKYGCKNYRSKVYNPSRNKTLWLDNLT